MALFERKKEYASGAPLYSVGSNKTLLVIGLGNPGKEHTGSRHNIGFEVLDHFAQKNDFPAWIAKKDLKCELTMGDLGENRVILCKPTTFMNLSGEAAQAVQHFYRIYNPQTLAVYDELAIPLGQLRTRLGGTDAGHNGVKSLIQYLGEDFGRLRIGTCPAPSQGGVVGNRITERPEKVRGRQQSDFVLGQFTKDEQKAVPKILQEANALITEYISGGQLSHDTRTVI